MRQFPPEPTLAQCSAREMVYASPEEVGFALWYPQMGGYASAAVAIFSRADPTHCIDVWVWHDGEFPFSGDEFYGDDKPPRLLHHCDPEQFIMFGQALEALAQSVDSTPAST